MEDSGEISLLFIVYGLWKTVARLDALQSHNRLAGRKAPPCENN